jgi:hypothetical protein
MYELYDPCTVMFFYRFVTYDITFCLELNPLNSSNKHIMIDLGTGNNNKMYVVLLATLRTVVELPSMSVTGPWITSKRYVFNVFPFIKSKLTLSPVD